MTSGTPQELRMNSSWCKYESKTVVYIYRIHTAPCDNCHSETHARCVCPDAPKPPPDGSPAPTAG